MSLLSLTRLVTAGGRGAWGRLAGMAGGIAVGVALLLLLFGAYDGLASRTERSTWTSLDYGVATQLVSELAAAAPSDDTVMASTVLDLDSLVVVTGVATGDLDPGRGSSMSGDALFGIWSVSEFRGSAYPSISYRKVAVIGAIAILLPVLILIGIVTRIGAAKRAERFAALRLIGATPRRVADIAAAETGVTSLAGALAGVALAWLLIPVAAWVEVGDGRFFRSDLTVAPITVIIVVAGVVAVSTAVA